MIARMIPAGADFRRLFLAQVVSLAGTGVTTIALALLARKLSPADSTVVLGVALGIKMFVYVVLTPVLSAWTPGLDRRKVLVAADLLRAAVVGAFFFVTSIWQVYLLVFLVSSLSALFTPIYQAAIPELLPDDADYNRALSLSRIAYDLENILSPLLAGLLLQWLGFTWLFVLDGATFLVSAIIISGVVFAGPVSDRSGRAAGAVLSGIRDFLKRPSLRHALALSWVVSFAGAMVIVNSVELVQGRFGLGETAVTLAFLAAGCGSILGAFSVPFLLRRMAEPSVMLIGGGLLTLGLFAGAFVQGIITLAIVWCVLGTGWALVQTPVGQVIRKNAAPEQRDGLFAAYFALSHLGWLLAYPAVGLLARHWGTALLFVVLACGGLLMTIIVALSGAVLRPMKGMKGMKGRPLKARSGLSPASTGPTSPGASN